MGDEGGDVVEPIFARLQAQLAFVRLDEVMLDVGSFAGRQPHRQRHRVALARLPYHEVLQRDRG